MFTRPENGGGSIAWTEILSLWASVWLIFLTLIALPVGFTGARHSSMFGIEPRTIAELSHGEPPPPIAAMVIKLSQFGVTRIVLGCVMTVLLLLAQVTSRPSEQKMFVHLVIINVCLIVLTIEVTAIMILVV